MSDEGKNIKDVIGLLFKENNSLSRNYNTYNIEQVWRDTFGEMISQYTTSVKFTKGTLTVFISSSALKHEIDMNKENVIQKINNILQYKKVERLLIK